MRTRNRRRPTPAFTLIELITVMAILAVLVALIVGAAQGIRGAAAHDETIQTIHAIEAGLAKYFDDWGKFPFTVNRGDLMGQVRADLRPPSGLTSGRGDQEAYVLYQALTLQERNGPYFTGAGGNTGTFETGQASGQNPIVYKAFEDGWGRPIHYTWPRTKADGTQAQFPLLISEGEVKDMQGDQTTYEDNITNYPVQTVPRNYFH